MKILTWNIYKNNKNIDNAIAFLKNGKFDIICLQEFPVHSADKLKSLGMHYILEDEFLIYKNPHRKPDKMHTVIISNEPIKNVGIIKHQNFYEGVTKQDDRYKHFSADSIYVDIDAPGHKLRIFNVHFKCVAGPYHRLSQFREVLENFDPKRENIICGDLNTFGHPIVNIFLWKYFGYRIQELFINEKKILRTHFDLNKLKNPFRGMITFIKFPMQLDYILLPKKTKISAKQRFLRPYGSDHLALSVEI